MIHDPWVTCQSYKYAEALYSIHHSMVFLFCSVFTCLIKSPSFLKAFLLNLLMWGNSNRAVLFSGILLSTSPSTDLESQWPLIPPSGTFHRRWKYRLNSPVGSYPSTAAPSIAPQGGAFSMQIYEHPPQSWRRTLKLVWKPVQRATRLPLGSQKSVNAIMWGWFLSDGPATVTK